MGRNCSCGVRRGEEIVSGVVVVSHNHSSSRSLGGI